MNKIIVLVRGISVAVGLLMSVTVFSQDPQFSQYYQAPLYLNPGFTGITQQQRFVFIHRNQWPGLPRSFSTFSASYDIWINELRSGFGILASTDRMGSAGWRTTNVGLNYSYKVKLTEKLVFSPGLNFGYGINGLDRSKLQMGDGIEFNGFSLDPGLQKLGNAQYFDFSSGFVLYNKFIFFGAAFSHINTPNISVMGTESRLPMKVVIHGGGRINLTGKGLLSGSRASYLTPSFVYRTQGILSQMELGVNYHVDPISIGAWYRGKPFEQTIKGTIQQDALVIAMGIYLKNITIGYSYDFTVSELSVASAGAHEFSIVYELSTTKNSSSKKKYRLIPCPSFNSTPGFWN